MTESSPQEGTASPGENSLLDQGLFLLDDAHHAKFVACLDEPVEPTEALRRILTTPSPWER
jgi:uncharacterized protein (DUF1778 family)